MGQRPLMSCGPSLLSASSGMASWGGGTLTQHESAPHSAPPAQAAAPKKASKPAAKKASKPKSSKPKVSGSVGC